MDILTTIDQVRKFVGDARTRAQTVGFVPTMGALHDGHLELIKASSSNNDLTICSIFVNPTQFNNPEDLEKYPRNLGDDQKLLEPMGCDAVFVPETSEIYENDRVLSISFGYLEEIMEGKFRPGHFRGVGLVVSKLFNIVQADKAYFGQKDLQQLIIVETMVKELNINTEIISIETIREKDGLAMSSRNQRLTKDQRKEATDLFRSLNKAKELLSQGYSPGEVKNNIEQFYKEKSSINLEYFEIVDPQSLRSIEGSFANQKVALCIAGVLGKVRLIDNLLVN